METPQQERPEPAPRPAGAASRILALTAIVLSLAALGVSVFEVSTIRDEQRMGVWPYIQLASRYNAEGFALLASNKGIGPARVRHVEVRYEGKVYEQLDELILNTIGPENAFSYDLYSTSDPTQSVLSPDEQVLLFGVPWEPRTRLLVDRWSGTVEVTLCYCSVYDECWRAHLDSGDPEPVEACPTP